jgi:mannose-6-phosphate isomerase-like protein (cupin superfamily)
MDELHKGLALCLSQSESADILTAFQAQLDAWGLAMPAVEPLVLDFGLGDFYRTGLIEYWIANETEAGYCGKFLFLFDSQTCPLHHHALKLETFFIVKGCFQVTYAGRSFYMHPGDVLRVEVGKPHAFTGKGPSLLLEVSKPSIIDDNYFQDTSILIGGNYQRGMERGVQ